MHGDYLITFRVWPFSTGKGANEDQRVTGPERRAFRVTAADFEAARAAALNIRRGIVSSGHVWNAPLEGIRYIKPGERVDVADADAPR